MLSTLASSKMLMSICTCESSCPSNAATAVVGIIRANSSKPSWNLSGNFTLFVRARSSAARVAWRRRDWNSLGASGGAGATSAVQLVFEFVERRVVSLEVALQFPVIRVVWERIETLQSVSLCCGLVERLLSLAPNAPSPVKQRGAEQDANPRNNQQRAERPVLLKPFHAINHGLTRIGKARHVDQAGVFPRALANATRVSIPIAHF